MRAHRSLCGAAHFAGQADFAEDGRVCIDRLIAKARRDCRHQPEVNGGLVNFQSAGNVNEHVITEQLHAHAFFQHRDQKSNAILIHALCHAAACAVLRTRHQRLNLDQHRPRAFHASGNNRARGIGRALCQKHLRGISDRRETRAGHFKDAHFIRRAKTIFGRAYNAMIVMALAFEI